jgi:hypothetical protein
MRYDECGLVGRPGQGALPYGSAQRHSTAIILQRNGKLHRSNNAVQRAVLVSAREGMEAHANELEGKNSNLTNEASHYIAKSSQPCAVR